MLTNQVIYIDKQRHETEFKKKRKEIFNKIPDYF